MLINDIVKYFKAKNDLDRLKQLEADAMRAVEAAEQGCPGDNEAKKAYAIDYLTRLGYEPDKDMSDAAVEASVYRMKQRQAAQGRPKRQPKPLTAEAFKRRWGHNAYIPMDVGKAAICSLTYANMPDRPEGDYLFTGQQLESLQATITTQEEYNQYVAYRQLEDWLTSRQTAARGWAALLYAHMSMISHSICEMIWAEEAIKGYADTLGREQAEANIFMHKLDTGRFTFDDTNEAQSYRLRDLIENEAMQVERYNTTVRLIAKEIKLPELATVFCISLDNLPAKVEFINANIQQLHDDLVARGYKEDDNGIGQIKLGAFKTHLRPYTVPSYKVPAANVKSAKELLTGLSVFKRAKGCTILDLVIAGRL